LNGRLGNRPPHGQEARTAEADAWDIYKIVSKAVWVGEVEASHGAAAIEKGTEEFKVPANRLMAIRR
jgi:hypothetical protein